MCVCAVCATMRARVRRCVQVCASFVCWNPTFISAFCFFLFAPLCCCCCRTMSSVSHRASSSQSSLLCGSHGTTAVAQQFVWTTSMRVLIYVGHLYVGVLCVLWYVNMWHMCYYSSTAAVMFKVNTRTQQGLFLLTSNTWYYHYFIWDNTTVAAHAPCFLQHKLWLCYLRVPFQLASPPGFHVSHIPKGNLGSWNKYRTKSIYAFTKYWVNILTKLKYRTFDVSHRKRFALHPLAPPHFNAHTKRFFDC